MARSQANGSGYRPSTAWRDDVTLEVWIDIEHLPASIRLAGTLDGATTPDLISVVEELMTSGHRSFILDTRELCIRGLDGADALADLKERVLRLGGRLTVKAGGTGREHSLGTFDPSECSAHPPQ